MVVKDFKVLGSGDEEVKQDLYYLSFQCWLSLHRVSGSKIPSPRPSQNASKSKTRPLKSGVETKTSLEYNNKGRENRHWDIMCFYCTPMTELFIKFSFSSAVGPSAALNCLNAAAGINIRLKKKEPIGSGLKNDINDNVLYCNNFWDDISLMVRFCTVTGPHLVAGQERVWEPHSSTSWTPCGQQEGVAKTTERNNAIDLNAKPWETLTP